MVSNTLTGSSLELKFDLLQLKRIDDLIAMKLSFKRVTCTAEDIYKKRYWPLSKCGIRMRPQPKQAWPHLMSQSLLDQLLSGQSRHSTRQLSVIRISEISAIILEQIL
ncbi:hypothetical protein V3C99_012996 [Haemonchus contortus]